MCEREESEREGVCVKERREGGGSGKGVAVRVWMTGERPVLSQVPLSRVTYSIIRFRRVGVFRPQASRNADMHKNNTQVLFLCIPPTTHSSVGRVCDNLVWP